MSGKHYIEEFKIEAVKQVADCGYSVLNVAEQLGVTTKKLYGNNVEQYQSAKAQQGVAEFLFNYGGKAANAFAEIDEIAVQAYPLHIIDRPDIVAHGTLNSW